jgi:acyl-CoA synthetase (AMP-forming)/AMP-acid ligase II
MTSTVNELHGMAGTLEQLLLDRETGCDGNTAYRFVMRADGEPVEWSYATLVARAKTIAAALQRRNLARERVLILCSIGEDYVSTLFGCLLSGAIAVPCTPIKASRNQSKILQIIQNCGPGLIVCDQPSAPKMRTLLDSFGLYEIEVVDPLQLSDEDNVWRRANIAADDIAFLQYTSGSTSAPKGVVVTHANILANLAAITGKFGLTRASRGLVWLPPYHDMGLVGGILNPLFVGYPVTLLAPLLFIQKPLRWLELVSRYRITASGGPNFGYQACVDRIQDADCADLDLRCWQLAFNGAERVNAATLERFTAKFARCGFDGRAHYPTYGMAEATLMISGGVQGEAFRVERHIPGGGEGWSRDVVCCGSVIDGHALLVVDADSGVALGEGGVGEIWFSGPSVARGYWNADNAAFEGALADRPGRFLRTGDLGVLIDGEVYLLGRAKEMVVLRGANYFPTDLENAIRVSHPALNPEGIVVFSCAAELTERLVVVAELKRNAKEVVDSEVRTRIVAAMVEEYDIAPDEVVLLDPGAMQRTSSGKLMRTAMKKSYLEKRPANT